MGVGGEELLIAAKSVATMLETGRFAVGGIVDVLGIQKSVGCCVNTGGICVSWLI